MSRRAATIALVAYLAFLAGVTLGSSPGELFHSAARTARHITGLGWVNSGVVERAANVLLFAPVGLLLCYALPALSRWLLWAVCVAVSASIETAQLVLPDRRSSLIDLLTNATGAAIGVLIHLAATFRSSGTPPNP